SAADRHVDRSVRREREPRSTLCCGIAHIKILHVGERGTLVAAARQHHWRAPIARFGVRKIDPSVLGELRMHDDIEDPPHRRQSCPRLRMEDALPVCANLVRVPHADEQVAIGKYQEAPRTVEALSYDRYSDLVLIGFENRRQRWKRIATAALSSLRDL